MLSTTEQHTRTAGLLRAKALTVYPTQAARWPIHARLLRGINSAC